MSNPKLTLEMLSGPLDGQTLTLKTEAEWSQAGEGPLCFPWDEQLGTPQARFFIEAGQWWLESISGQRSTRHNGERIESKMALDKGDLVKAARTWLLYSD